MNLNSTFETIITNRCVESQFHSCEAETKVYIIYVKDYNSKTANLVEFKRNFHSTETYISHLFRMKCSRY